MQTNINSQEGNSQSGVAYELVLELVLFVLVTPALWAGVTALEQLLP